MTADDTGQVRATSRAFEDMVLQHSNDAAMLIHPTDGVVYASPATSRVLGLEPTSLVGMMAADWVHPDDVDTALELRHHSTLHGHGGPVELRGRHGDGTYHWYEAEWWHVVHHYTVLHLREVERERAVRDTRDRTAARLEALLRQSRELFVILRADLSGFDYVSGSVERILGWTGCSTAEPTWSELVHPEDLDPLLRLIADARAVPGTSCASAVRCRTQDGDWRRLDVAVTDLTDDPNVAGVVVNAWVDDSSDDGG